MPACAALLLLQALSPRLPSHHCCHGLHHHVCPLNNFAAAGLIITSALMIWKSLMLVTGSESPCSAFHVCCAFAAMLCFMLSRHHWRSCSLILICCQLVLAHLLTLNHGTVFMHQMQSPLTFHFNPTCRTDTAAQCPIPETKTHYTHPWYFCLPLLQVVVVLSGSMEPGFYRGDILFLNMGKNPIRAGEIVVFNLDGRDIPIVHRVIKVSVCKGQEFRSKPASVLLEFMACPKKQAACLE
eukprot:scaffold200295_cov19-Tisochrysis_lutea.AAC.1